MLASNVAIKVENLSKCYQIYGSPRDRLKQFVLPRLQRAVGRQTKKYCREFWALKDVNFEIVKGETVGIIGRNGSGKSTLLQIICGTLSPTSGSIQTDGRIAALLELGSGFNPEFTGRENVYMNASVLGLSRDETDAKFDDIAAFADIGDFIERPVKTYSSGMMMRLAFSVSANVDPQILIVDEALSVGDELFQRKCFSRIEAIRARGATILFVSHSGSAIIELCDRAVLMDAGEKLTVGLPKEIVGRYQKLLHAPIEKREIIKAQIRAADEEVIDIASAITHSTSAVATSIALHENDVLESFDPNLEPSSTLEYESHGPLIGTPTILTSDGRRVNGLVRGRKYRYCYPVVFNGSATKIRFGMSIKSTTGFSIGGALSAVSSATAIPIVEHGKTVNVEFSFYCNLNPGIFFMNAGVFGIKNEEEAVLHRRSDVIAFRVLPIQENIETEIVSFNFEAKVSMNA